MTILQVCAYAAPYEGNFIKSLKALATRLKNSNVKMIYAFPENAENIDWVKRLSAETDVYFLPLSKARVKPKTYVDLKKIYQKYLDLKIIHSHFELYDVPVSLTAPKTVKVFWHLHDALEVYSSFRNRMIHHLQYGLFHKKATLLAVSEKHMCYVIQCGFPKRQAYYLPNGLDADRICRVSRDISKRSYNFTIFGWEFERKGVDLCIEAVRKYGIDCKIAVVGSGATVSIVKEKYGSVPQIEIIEPVSDINTLYMNTGCFLHISRAEGLSYALLEAVYAGLPIICSDIDENLFAKKFPTVDMVKNEDVESIANAMKRHMSINTVTNHDVNTCREIIEKEYSIECWVGNLIRKYGIEDD